MKKLFRLSLSAALTLMSISASAEIVSLNGTEYDVVTVTDTEIGPGIRHTRFRVPDFPLNVNVLRVDLNNPYNHIETTIANGKSCGTERLVAAGQRQSYEGHRAIAGANANFWTVSSQAHYAVYPQSTFGASVRNGQISIESNQHYDQWNGGTMRTGVVGMSNDKTMYVDYCTSYIHATSAKFGTLEVWQSNKGIHRDELAMYNSFYGTDKQFVPMHLDASIPQFYIDPAGDATEVILDFAEEGSRWASNTDVKFIVKEVRLNAGNGTLGQHDLALVGRGSNATALANLAIGDEVTLHYGWIFNPGTENEKAPQLEQVVCGNAMVMRNGELTTHNDTETYNSQIYSRCGYGTSTDGKTMYLIVIDKSTDPVHGISAGCNTRVMCDIAKWLGCVNLSNMDAGGSAQMLINGAIENRTTEGTPRAVANGWLVYSTAPENTPEASTVARLEFRDVELQSPIYSSFTPKIIAYNTYGAVIDEDFQEFTLSCSEGVGTCSGTTLTASGSPISGTLTATYGTISVTKEIDIIASDISLRIPQILIDGTREYPIEVISYIGDYEFTYNPASFTWAVDAPSVATIDETGTLRGIAEGTTPFSCKVGEFEQQGTVTVEISPLPQLAQEDWSGWTAKKASGISNVSLTNEGVLSFDYGSPRNPYVSLTKDVRFYSLPDGIFLEFTSDLPISNITADFRSAQHTKLNNIEILPTDGAESFVTGTKHTVELPINALGDPADLALYPITLKSLRFNIVMNSENAGTHNITLGQLYSTYNNFAGISEIEVGNDSRLVITPNPVVAGSELTVTAVEINAVSIYSTTGALVAIHQANGCDSLTFTAPSTGAYVVKVDCASGIQSSIIIVR